MHLGRWLGRTLLAGLGVFLPLTVTLYLAGWLLVAAEQLAAGVIKAALPKHAQEIYVEAYNSAYDQYEDPSKRRGDESREETAHRVAWSAVGKQYEKGDDGKWHRQQS